MARSASGEKSGSCSSAGCGGAGMTAAFSVSALLRFIVDPF
jgi:hypothetical protein